MSKTGSGDYLKGEQLSPLNKLSDELSCGLMWGVQAEISGQMLIGLVVDGGSSGGGVVVELMLFPGREVGGTEGG